MKKHTYVFTVFLLLAVLLTAQTTYAQSTKELKALKKEWNKKKKEMDPLAFKQLVEDNEQCDTEISRLQSRVSNLEQQAQPDKDRIKELEGKISSLEMQLEEAHSQATETSSAPATNSKVPTAQYNSTKGLVYKVQIGAFRNKDLTKYFDNSINFSGDVDSDGTKKYTLGYFRDYWEADNFKKYLREMGVKDAWIVSYKNGKRVPIKDALEGVL